MCVCNEVVSNNYFKEFSIFTSWKFSLKALFHVKLSHKNFSHLCLPLRSYRTIHLFIHLLLFIYLFLQVLCAIADDIRNGDKQEPEQELNQESEEIGKVIVTQNLEESKNCVEEGEVQNEYLDARVDKWNGDELKEENVSAIDHENVIQEREQEINDTIEHSLHQTDEKDLIVVPSSRNFKEKELRTKRRKFLNAMQSYKFYQTNEIQNTTDNKDENTIDCIESDTDQKPLNLKYLNFENLQTTVQVSTSFHLG